MNFLLAIDQGTTNSRAIIFDRLGNRMASHEMPLTSFFPQDGWIEQNPEEMFNNTVSCCREALKKANITAANIAAVGLSNQRETTILWEKYTGKPIYPAIVWQDRRTHLLCQQLKQTSFAQLLSQKTGLLLDPYFSATKIVWLLDHIAETRERAEKGELLFGTVDTYLLWKLTDGQSHATDASNASRTLLFNIHTQEWDKEILTYFNIPANLLPIVLDNAAHFGKLDENILGHSIPICGMAGDQQAATIGQACFQPGMVKATYGTGGFMLFNTGTQVVRSQNCLLSTVAYRLNNHVTYGLEGSIFCAGSTVKWLRDKLQLIHSAAETETLAQHIHSNEGVYLVPAFTGLGAPYWNAEARGALFGLTRNSGKEHIARAALESVAYQTRDLLNAMLADSHQLIAALRVDGGMVANHWLLQFLSDMLNVEIQQPVCIETSALGVAFLAGLQIGMYASLEELATLWQKQLQFNPHMPKLQRDTLYAAWQRAVKSVMDYSRMITT
ncbi:MAG: glycerol kinase [Gammaproteobacteria bacterium RIFCSPHIGHO2_12_FULL_37_34]|nr:MAG: glycerol kinase [Gammaproteobacteria bacterium RIFCSPHIGHO2_12_FULL_37_34]